MDQPPSYTDVFAGKNPSAPLMTDNHPVHHQPAHNPGWNQNMSHHPQYPVTDQPMVHQQVVQRQTIPQQTIVIINQQIQVGESPVVMICPHCQQQTVTRINYVSSYVTHSVAGIMCILGCCPCAIIPYCSDCLKDAVHTCSKCKGYIGTYRRSRSRHRF